LIVAGQCHLQAVERVPTGSKLSRLEIAAAIQIQLSVLATKRKVPEIHLEVCALPVGVELIAPVRQKLGVCRAIRGQLTNAVAQCELA
jgi:hypothetical protein